MYLLKMCNVNHIAQRDYILETYHHAKYAANLKLCFIKYMK